MLPSGRECLSNILFEIVGRLQALKDAFAEIDKAPQNFPEDAQSLSKKWRPTVDEWIAMQSRVRKRFSNTQGEELDWENLIQEVGTTLKTITELNAAASQLTPPTEKHDPWKEPWFFETIRTVSAGLNKYQQLIETQEYKKEWEEVIRSRNQEDR